jgi:N-sulfoglucosamine sulfohydrolase
MKHPTLFTLALSFCLTAASAAEKKPNILFLFADDWGRYASILRGSEGPGTINDVVETPHFDRIAKEGVFFRNAHVSAPSCTPCRSALLTGQHFWRTNTGAILRGAVWDASIPSYPLLLQEAGYHIGYTHKVWGPGTPANSPFTKEQSYAKRGGRFNQFSQNVTKAVAEGNPLEEAKAELIEESRGNFEDFLAAREGDEPWCYWFGPTNVHRKWIKGSGKALWGIDPDTLKGKMPPFLPDVPEVREDLADYFGEIAAWDAGIGALLAEVEKRGEKENTLVVISGDHGAPGFPHGKCNLYGFGTNVCLSITGPGVKGGRIVDDFASLTDLAPTFLEAAGLKAPEVMTGRSLWTVLKSGKSGLVDETRTRVFTGRERHVENARSDYTPYPQRAIRTADHVLIVNFRPDRYPMGDPYLLDSSETPGVDELENETRVTLPDEDSGPTKAWLVGVRNTPEWKEHYEWVYGKRPRYELYDLKKDPHETTNLADDPAYAEVKAALEKELLAELSRTGDPRLIDDGKFFETPPMAGPLPDAEEFGKEKGPKGKGKGKGKSKGAKE